MLTRTDRIALCIASFAGIWGAISAAGYLTALHAVSEALRRALGVL